MRIATRSLLAPEVIQTSAVDCGPAALKCLLAGFGIRASYGRLREVCHTSVDGTSIDALEAIALDLGLEVEQVTLPAEHLVLAEADALPAMVVVTLPSGLTHFLVVWRVHGPWVQVMDPARGRRWMSRADLLRDVYLHEQVLRAADFRAWTESDGFLDPLRRRLRRLGVGDAAALVERALGVPGWQGPAALEAATRTTEALVQDQAVPRARAVKVLHALHVAAGGEGGATLPDGFWLARPAGMDEAGDPQVRVRGAVILRAIGRRGAASGPSAAGVLAGVVGAAEPGPVVQLMGLVRADGLWRLGPIALALALAGGGAAFEALLLRGVLDVGRHLTLVEQRLAAVGVLAALVLALFLIDWPVQRGLAAVGRRLELGLRRAFTHRLPRLADQYFQSRPISDLAERAHLVHWVRALPGQAGRLVRTTAELVATTVGIAWLHPPSAGMATLLALAMIVVPLAFQPALVERDLRMRAHAGGLARFYLDALLGLVAIRAHGAEGVLAREHGERLDEWAQAARAAARTSVAAEATQALLGFVLAAWLLHDYLTRAPGSGWALLLVYWALALPVLGQEIAFIVQQYPHHRNVTARLLEPLGAPVTLEHTAGWAAPAPAGGAAIAFEEVVARAAGQDLLATGTREIAAGTHVALVGPSGGGKSSLLGLLLGFHVPASGRLLVDGAPLEGAVLARLRQDTVWVEPGVQLWNRTLLENLRYGPVGVGGVADALAEADLDQVLVRLPAGLQTPLGEGGTLLSGGEGQRVRFARGVCRGGAGRLVLLDEPFRGLERPRRQVLLQRARRRWSGATLLWATHDVADTIGFDRVLVVEGGRIVEDGAPAELAAASGSRYAALVAADRRVRARLSDAGWRRITLDDGQVSEANAVTEAS